MSSRFMKIWSLNGVKKALKASCLNEFKEKGALKLNLNYESSEITIYMDDGTEVDEDEILLSLSEGTILYLCGPGEMPGQKVVPNCYDTSTSSVDDEDLTSHTFDKAFDKSMDLLKRPWPKEFKISFGRFSTDLNMRAMKGVVHMTWQARHELLNILSEDILIYTMNPNMEQRKQVVECLFQKFPSLRSTGLSYGASGWAQRIYEKMKDVRIKLNNFESKAKLKPKKNSKNVKSPSRGEANWAPDVSHDVTAIETSQIWMLKEAQKLPKDRNEAEIKICLEITFSSRRIEFQKHPPLSLFEMIKKYPLLFTDIGLQQEFKCMQVKEPFDLIVNLHSCAEKIISLANKKSFPEYPGQERPLSELQKMKKNSSQIRGKVLKSFHDCLPPEKEQTLTAAFLLLPISLNEDSDFVYKILDSSTSIDDIPLGTSSPIIVCVGDPLKSNEIYICGEGSILIEADNASQAICMLFCIFYVCNIVYPEKANCSFLFMQTFLLELHYSKKLPAKLVNFIERI